MSKVKHSVATRRRKKRLLKRTKGFWGDRSKQFRQAKRSLMHALVYSYRDRKNRKREYRRLWIVRINAACRATGMTYSAFMKGLTQAQVKLDRKIIADIAVNDPKVFEKLVTIAKG